MIEAPANYKLPCPGCGKLSPVAGWEEPSQDPHTGYVDEPATIIDCEDCGLKAWPDRDLMTDEEMEAAVERKIEREQERRRIREWEDREAEEYEAIHHRKDDLYGGMR